MKSSVSTNICYAFLALSITMLPAACALPDSGPAGTPAKPAEEKPKLPVSPPVPKTWRWSRLTNSENPHIRGLQVSPHGMLSVMVRPRPEDDDLFSILIRRFSISSNREEFPVRFFTGHGKNAAGERDTSIKLHTKREICRSSYDGRTEVCEPASWKYLNAVVFDSRDKVYVLDSTGDYRAAASPPVRIIAFTKNVRSPGASPREVLAGSVHGNVDAAGANAKFRAGVRNMALSTDEKYIYVADWKNNSVRAVEIQNKKVTTLKPTDKEGKAVGLPAPTGIAVGKGKTVYTISNSGGVGTIAALTVPLPLPADNVVRARVLTLIDEKGKAYQLRDNPVWYIAVDDNGVLYSHIQRDGARYIVRIRLKDANAEDLVGVVSEVAVMRGVSSASGTNEGCRGLEVSGDGKTIYYASSEDVYAYTYE